MTDTLRSVRVVEIIDAWRSLAVHGGACSTCSTSVETLCTSHDPRRDDAAAEATMCEEGKVLFATWWDAKVAWLAQTEELRRRQFLTQAQLWDDGQRFEQRAAALMGMPGPDFNTWLTLPDDRRHQQLRSLEAALAHAPIAKRCALPSCDHQAAPGYDYCSSDHQAKHRRQERRGRLELVSTED